MTKQEKKRWNKKINDDLRTRSGTITSYSKLVSFLYELLRDHVTPSIVEEICRNSCREGKTIYSNGYLAKYAEDIANRLKDSDAVPADNVGEK